jgi:hypothetical protein
MRLQVGDVFTVRMQALTIESAEHGRISQTSVIDSHAGAERGAKAISGPVRFATQTALRHSDFVEYLFTTEASCALLTIAVDPLPLGYQAV